MNRILWEIEGLFRSTHDHWSIVGLSAKIFFRASGICNLPRFFQIPPIIDSDF